MVFPGRLRERLQFWEVIGVSSFVLSVIRDGFRLPLVAVPQRKVMSVSVSFYSDDGFQPMQKELYNNNDKKTE